MKKKGSEILLVQSSKYILNQLRLYGMGDPIQAHSESSRQLKQNVGCRNIAPAKKYFICIESYLLWSTSCWGLHFHLVEYAYFCCKLAFCSPIKSLVSVDYSCSVSCILQQIQYCNKYKFIFGLFLHAEVPYLSSGSKIELHYFSQVTSWITLYPISKPASLQNIWLVVAVLFAREIHQYLNSKSSFDMVFEKNPTQSSATPPGWNLLW